MFFFLHFYSVLFSLIARFCLIRTFESTDAMTMFARRSTLIPIVNMQSFTFCACHFSQHQFENWRKKTKSFRIFLFAIHFPLFIRIHILIGSPIIKYYSFSPFSFVPHILGSVGTGTNSCIIILFFIARIIPLKSSHCCYSQCIKYQIILLFYISFNVWMS